MSIVFVSGNYFFSYSVILLWMLEVVREINLCVWCRYNIIKCDDL